MPESILRRLVEAALDALRQSLRRENIKYVLVIWKRGSVQPVFRPLFSTDHVTRLASAADVYRHKLYSLADSDDPAQSNRELLELLELLYAKPNSLEDRPWMSLPEIAEPEAALTS